MPDFKQLAAAALAKTLPLPEDEILGQLVLPPKPEMGDIGFPCFPLAKTLKKAPPLIAQEMAGQVECAPPFAEVKAVGPYINFTLDAGALARDVLPAILDAPERWGRCEDGAGKTVVIDYSSPNIAKPLGVHHIRSTMIGAALARLYTATGWQVVTVNHLGDWGTTFGQLMVAYKRDEANLSSTPMTIEQLLQLYVSFHADAESDEALKDEARDWFRRLEAGDAEATRLWQLFVNVTLQHLKKLYARLSITFDHYTGESFFNNRMDATIERLTECGLLSEGEGEGAGMEVVRLDDEEMPPCLIRKKDGATTYATRDLAAAEYRQAEYHFNRCLYVVANQQELHFRQIFRVLQKMGYDWADACSHVKFGMLSFGEGVFGAGGATASTRRGRVVYLEDVLDRAVEKAREVITENAREDTERDSIDTLSEQIGVGAVIFSEFLQRRTKDVTFTWEKAINLQGDSGPYLQYTHARLCSLERRYGQDVPAQIDWTRLMTAYEKAVLLKIAEFPDVIRQAVRDDEPSVVATYLLDLAAVFNRLFTSKDQHRIVSEDEALTAARVAMVACVRQTLASGLDLLGLSAPTRM